MKKYVFALCAGCLVTSTYAQYANIEGFYSSETTSLQIILLDDDSGVAAASTSVVIGGCSGTIVGIGKVSGNVLQFKPYKKEEGAEECVITATFNKKRTKATIEESQCGYYHGASCAWEGQSVNKKR